MSCLCAGLLVLKEETMVHQGAYALARGLHGHVISSKWPEYCTHSHLVI